MVSFFHVVSLFALTVIALFAIDECMGSNFGKDIPLSRSTYSPLSLEGPDFNLSWSTYGEYFMILTTSFFFFR
jgi:hypothetical protein